MTTPLRDRYDAIIAGARCAGAATAMLLARAGLSVLVVDPLPRGRDTLSTHALMRGGVLQLRRWGILPAIIEADTPAVRTTTFDYDGQAVSIEIRERDGVDALYAPRRTLLDPLLANAAERAGAHVVHGASVTDVVRDRTGRVSGAIIATADGPETTVAAGLVVGADGVHSRVARAVGAPVLHRYRHAAATIFGYWPGTGPAEYRWGYRPGMSMGVIPTNDGLSCVFVSVPAPRFPALHEMGLDAAFLSVLGEADPELTAAVATGPRSGPLRAFAGIRSFLRQATGPGWALVGDAGCFRDPITAHGITDALRDAELLARAVLDGGDDSLPGYQQTRDATVRDLMDITDRIAAHTWSMDEIMALHHALSRAMNAGVEVIRSFDSGSAADTAAA